MTGLNINDGQAAWRVSSLDRLAPLPLFTKFYFDVTYVRRYLSPLFSGIMVRYLHKTLVWIWLETFYEDDESGW